MAIDVASIDFGSGAEWEQITIPAPTYHEDFPATAEFSKDTSDNVTPNENIYSSILTTISPGIYRIRGWMFASGHRRFGTGLSSSDRFADTPLWGLRKKQESGSWPYNSPMYFRYKTETNENPYSTLVYKEEVFIVPPSASLFNLWLFDYSYFVFQDHTHASDLILEKMVD